MISLIDRPIIEPNLAAFIKPFTNMEILSKLFLINRSTAYIGNNNWAKPDRFH